MSSFKSLCEKYFGCSNFYEILKINTDASEKEIKKAYHKLSLLVHPDRVSEDEKQIATEKFKALGKIHSILQDKEKRKIYDDCGDFDEEESSFNWMDYWRKLFKKIELEDIQNYEREYVGSDTELRDIKKAYVGSKGNMSKILEMVPFSNCDSEPRIMEIVQKMVEDGEVERYDCFFNESKVKKLRRCKKWEKEKEEAEQINIQEIDKGIEENMKKRASQFADFLSDLESKYAPKKARKSITDGKPTAAKTRKSKRK